MVVLPNKRLLKITVDNVLTKNDKVVRMLFVATDQNTILKYMLINFFDEELFNKSPTSPSGGGGGLNYMPTVCLLEEIDIFEPNSKANSVNSINNLVFLKNDKNPMHQSRHLLIATKFSLIKMPVSNCESHTNYFSCLSLMDPYW